LQFLLATSRRESPIKEKVMPRIDFLPGTQTGNGRVIPVPWRSAEGLQTHLRRRGIGSTILWEPSQQGACLEIWAGADMDRVWAALAERPG
jgi:hypothetical protein